MRLTITKGAWDLEPRPTRGPWRYDLLSGKVFQAETGAPLAQMWINDRMTSREPDANGRLMAAAPELMRLLSAFLDHFCYSDVPSVDDDGGAGRMAWQDEADRLQAEAEALLASIRTTNKE